MIAYKKNEKQQKFQVSKEKVESISSLFSV